MAQRHCPGSIDIDDCNGPAGFGSSELVRCRNIGGSSNWRSPGFVDLLDEVGGNRDSDRHRGQALEVVSPPFGMVRDCVIR